MEVWKTEHFNHSQIIQLWAGIVCFKFTEMTESMYLFYAPPLSLSLRVLKAILWIKHTELSYVMCCFIYDAFLGGITPINP